MGGQTQLNFNRGFSSNLPTIGVDGALYLTKDTDKLFHSIGGELKQINVCKAHHFSNEESLYDGTISGDSNAIRSKYQIGDSIYVDNKYYGRVVNILDLYSRTSSNWCISSTKSFYDSAGVFATVTLQHLGGGTYKIEVEQSREPIFDDSFPMWGDTLPIAWFDQDEVPYYRVPEYTMTLGEYGLRIFVNDTSYYGGEVLNFGVVSIALRISTNPSFDLTSIDGEIISFSNSYLSIDKYTDAQTSLVWDSATGVESAWGRVIQPLLDGNTASIYCAEVISSQVKTDNIYTINTSEDGGYHYMFGTSVSGYDNSINLSLSQLYISSSNGDTVMSMSLDGSGVLTIPKLSTGIDFTSSKIYNHGDINSFPSSMNVAVLSSTPETRAEDTIYIITE
jgi:hypothetical protein